MPSAKDLTSLLVVAGFAIAFLLWGHDAAQLVLTHRLAVLN
jgi:hypothetical protein